MKWWYERGTAPEVQAARIARQLAQIADQKAEIARRQAFAEVLVEVLRAAVALQAPATKRHDH